MRVDLVPWLHPAHSLFSSCRPVSSPAEQAVENANLTTPLFHLNPLEAPHYLLFDTSHRLALSPALSLSTPQFTPKHQTPQAFSSGLHQAWTPQAAHTICLSLASE